MVRESCRRLKSQYFTAFVMPGRPPAYIFLLLFFQELFIFCFNIFSFIFTIHSPFSCWCKKGVARGCKKCSSIPSPQLCTDIWFSVFVIFVLKVEATGIYAYAGCVTTAGAGVFISIHVWC